MIKQPNFLKWSLNSKNNNSKNFSHQSHRNWIHQPEALKASHVAYVVKFLGKTGACQPKGIGVVKDGIHKLKFNHQLKRSEGCKVPKVELSISVNGVAIQDPKTKHIFHQYPLHQISYCADDKADKKFFSFIAKEKDSEKHSCFVFISDKLAEEITLTIGQAFDLAYRQFLDSSGRELEMKKRLIMLQKKVRDLEEENYQLHKKLETLQQNDNTIKIKKNKSINTIHNHSESIPVPFIQPPPPVPHRHSEGRMRNATKVLLCDFNNSIRIKDESSDLLKDLRDLERNDSDAKNRNIDSQNGNTQFNQDPFDTWYDPFGMGNFTLNYPMQTLETAIGDIDKTLLEMQDGFQRGLSFGKDNFSTDCFENQNK